MDERPSGGPLCGGTVLIRSGHACGRQRWRCKGCGRQFTRTEPRGKPVAMKAAAVELYCTGLSLSAIGKRLGVSAQSVHALGQGSRPAALPQARTDRSRPPWSRSTRSGTLSKKSQQALDLEGVRARHWPADRLGVRRPRPGHAGAPLGAWNPGPCGCSAPTTTHPTMTALPAGRHYIGKDQTQRSESNNARQRHWFARFRRRTCVVSRSVEMVDATMALFAYYHCNGGQLTPALVG